MLAKKLIYLNPPKKDTPKQDFVRDSLILYDTTDKKYYVTTVDLKSGKISADRKEVIPPCDIVSYYKKTVLPPTRVNALIRYDAANSKYYVQSIIKKGVNEIGGPITGPGESKEIIKPSRDIITYYKDSAASSIVTQAIISHASGKYYIQSIDPKTQKRSELSEITDVPSDIELSPVTTITEPYEEISIIDTDKGIVAYSREVKNEGSANRFSPEGKVTWMPTSLTHAPTAFSWSKERDKEFGWPSQSHFAFTAGSPLTLLQKQHIEGALIERINDFKKSCTSLEEYKQGLLALIQGHSAEFLRDEAFINFAQLEESLTFESLIKLSLNTREGVSHENHLATIDEAKQYTQRVLQKALNEVDNTYQDPIPRLEGLDGYRLSPSNSLLEANHPLGPEKSRQLLYMFRTIAKVQQSQTTNVKNGASEENLIEADRVLTHLLKYLGNERLTTEDPSKHQDLFTAYIAGFLHSCLMSSELAYEGKSSTFQKAFLIPLQQNIQAKIKALQAARRPAARVSAASAEGVEGIEVDQKDLLNPGMRTKLQEWFTEHKLPILKHNESTKTLSGTLFNDKSINIVIHSNKLLVNKASGSLTDEELRESMREIIRILRDIYGEAPPLRPLGTPEQKAVILEVFKAEGIKIKPEPAADSSDENEPPNEAGLRSHNY
jgi:hypothetical protein